MSLQNWLAQGWIQKHKSSREEIRNLLAVADRDLTNAQIPQLSAEWRLMIAYNGALQSANAAIAASGFRVSTKVSHHRYLIESLLFTVQAETKLVNQLNRFRKKRNISAYEQSETVSDHEATAMINLAREVHSLVQVWLAKHHAELL
ncbi:MAG TPA: hypothetical protein VH079_17465 [Terriglobales bacterium]|nr:hypothetical protein [Terriglobales bacterium]